MEYFLTAGERGDLDLDKYCAGERRVLWCCNRHKNEIEHNRVVLIEACSIRCNVVSSSNISAVLFAC